jgi:predicted acyl esterase
MQWLAARGFVVAFTNPRGSAGSGLDFRKSIIGRWGTDDHKDVKRLGDWLFSRAYVDPKRVGVTGGSYGGYMTNWVVTHETRYAAACTQRCVSYMNSMFGTSDFGWSIVHEMGGPPWKDDRGLKKQSPLCFVVRRQVPHAAADRARGPGPPLRDRAGPADVHGSEIPRARGGVRDLRGRIARPVTRRPAAQSRGAFAADRGLVRAVAETAAVIPNAKCQMPNERRQSLTRYVS